MLSDQEFGMLIEEHQTQARSRELQAHESLIADYRSEVERLRRSFEVERDRLQQSLLNRIERILRWIVTKK